MKVTTEMDTDITKSSRHSKIIGEFGENLICNWLSRSGFEVTLVDHTGMDVLAYNPSTEQRLGITVKSRPRNVGKEKTHVNIFSYRKGKNDRKRLLDACKAFSCEPWIGVYVETQKSADAYLISLAKYDEKYRGKQGKAIEVWKMREKDRTLYVEDQEVKHIKIDFHATNWHWS